MLILQGRPCTVNKWVLYDNMQALIYTYKVLFIAKTVILIFVQRKSCTLIVQDKWILQSD